MNVKISVFSFVIFILTVFIFSCSLSEPKLSEKQKEWKLFNEVQVSSDGGYKIISDGFKLLNIYKISDLTYVDWGWKVTVVNNSDNIYDVSLTYTLLDDDGFELVESKNDYLSISPGETRTYQKENRTNFFDFKRVSNNRKITLGFRIPKIVSFEELGIKPSKAPKSLTFEELQQMSNNPQ